MQDDNKKKDDLNQDLQGHKEEARQDENSPGQEAKKDQDQSQEDKKDESPEQKFDQDKLMSDLKEAKDKTAHMSKGLLKNKFVLIGGGAILALLLIISLLGSRNISIDLNKYLNVEFHGYEGAGYAEDYFDVAGLKADYGEKVWNKIKKSNKIKNELELFGYNLGPDMAMEALYYSAIGGSLDKTENLSTGDQVSYNWFVDEDYAKDFFKVKLNYKDKDFKVEGLEPLASIDPFKDIEVRFSGVSPYINAEIINNTRDEELLTLNFDVDRSSGIKNGEEVTVYVSGANGEVEPDAFSSRGFLLSSTSKTFKVEDQATYINELQDLPEDIRSQMEKQAKDVYTAYASKNWNEGSTLKSLDYVGSYLLKNKFDNGDYNDNIYILVLKYVCNVDDEDGYKATNEGYQAFRFYDLVLDNGNIDLDLKEMEFPNKTYTFEASKEDSSYTRTYWIRGYQSIDDLFKDEISSNIDNYTYEASDGLK